jgi:hypothetical protein
MNTAGHGFDPLEDSDQYVGILAGARGASDVVAAVRDYLAAWPKERVASVQRVDGGWAPFDANQQPTPLYRSADVHKICDSVHGQCASLQGAGVAPSPELLELDMYLCLACVKLTEFELGLWTERPPLTDRQPNSRVQR